MRIMITGATGFIGQNLCRMLGTLIANGSFPRDVKIYATWHRTSPATVLLDTCPVIIWIQQDWNTAPSKDLPVVDVVFHLAAAIPSQQCTSVVASQLNQQMDAHVLAYAVGNKAKLIYASSMAVYHPASQEIEESCTAITQKPYGLEKYMFEEEAIARLSEKNIPFVSLRISSPYGAGANPSTVLPFFVRRAFERKSLLYHGSGNRKQDFIYVEDVTRGFIAAIHSPEGVYHLASGKPVTMRELAVTIATLTGLSAKEYVQPSGHPDPEEERQARYSVSHSKTQLGWFPQVSLEEGLLSLLAATHSPVACS